MNKEKAGMSGVLGCAAAAMLMGCQCCPPVGECAVSRTEVDICKNPCAPATVACRPAASTVTVTNRDGNYCSPTMQQVTVRTTPAYTRMVFVYARPREGCCYNVESRNFERPWPWGPYGMGCCDYY